MKKTLKTLLASLTIVLFGVGSVGASCTTICSHSVDGTYCTVILTEYEDSHTLTITCLDGYHFSDTYDGHFGEGTICGGTTPASCN